MSGTFSQMYVQLVFAVSGRRNLLLKPWRETVFKYISGIITQQGQKSIIVNGVEDHVHLFVGLKPSMRISDLMREVKHSSTDFINQEKFIRSKFNWQAGYGAFTYSKSHIDNVYNYILNQEAHHRKETFRDEYIRTLKEFEIEFDEKYLFEWIDMNESTES
jgi:putative transposase